MTSADDIMKIMNEKVASQIRNWHIFLHKKNKFSLGIFIIFLDKSPIVHFTPNLAKALGSMV